MKQLKKEADHRVTLYKTGRIGDIMVSAKGEFFYLKKGILYGKTDGMSGYSSIKLLQNAMKKANYTFDWK